LFCCVKKGKRPIKKYLPLQTDYINHKGEFAINPQFDIAYPFTNEIALVQVENKWGYIDENGKYIINPYKYATIFSEGLVFVAQEGGYITCIDNNNFNIVV
jgi:hypothetical protein